ncbi:MAG: VCBS repeat-containing protein [Candidatus Midichloria mitochondrii]|uniref:FG-GAP repeat domain-containing protein n=1 Tax=Candidatus Midichloria mitochondrii TaxID=234827 RepID=UPI0002D303A9|nr:VCBS repeat-containing protein [Candidatus Midichloria mitochondrii]MDJ1255988.1 VCBS repeat-containing protein [Candidatus Midichloria mitochondrii]MDJ1287932.1 VCBS repeat-containing protein [Candidatus Midichloria mitochondrii]MDJ1298517.1 VCBS repeat-containing protein [Candidatus Midichloria mitochondrii]MDJ1312668.1 VCBS repeat-containing protein [Candidatus Midichloria mitochondrii]MDJ1583195.1 VCBS repeat-containing protein [Candidatus Midichloria mitochondrii]
MADFNADGRRDIVGTIYVSNIVIVLIGKGDLDFEIFTYGVGPNPWGVAVADFNDDNKLDIITAHRVGTNIGILLGNGNGGFQPAKIS